VLSFRARSLTTAVVAPAVPLRLTSASVKPLTGSEKRTVKLIGLVLAGSACPAACSIMTEGAAIVAAAELGGCDVTIPGGDECHAGRDIDRDQPLAAGGQFEGIGDAIDKPKVANRGVAHGDVLCREVKDSSSTRFQLTLTSPVYQPSLPRVPSIRALMLGVVVSLDTSARLWLSPAAMAATPRKLIGT
jgi:hypothetical protein